MLVQSTQKGMDYPHTPLPVALGKQILIVQASTARWSFFTGFSGISTVIVWGILHFFVNFLIFLENFGEEKLRKNHKSLSRLIPKKSQKNYFFKLQNFEKKTFSFQGRRITVKPNILRKRTIFLWLCQGKTSFSQLFQNCVYEGNLKVLSLFFLKKSTFSKKTSFFDGFEEIPLDIQKLIFAK